jgi:hypothetical protein
MNYWAFLFRTEDVFKLISLPLNLKYEQQMGAIWISGGNNCPIAPARQNIVVQQSTRLIYSDAFRINR